MLTEPTFIRTNFNVLSLVNNEGNITYTTVLKDNDYIPKVLFEQNNHSTYTKKIYELKPYTNSLTLNNFTIDVEIINGESKNMLNIVSPTTDYFVLNSTSIYQILYNQVTYLVTLTLNSTNKYEISGLEIGQFTNINSINYSIVESLLILQPTLFTLTGNQINSSEFSNINTDVVNSISFKYSGSTTIDSQQNLLLYNNRYYQVNISDNYNNELNMIIAIGGYDVNTDLKFRVPFVSLVNNEDDQQLISPLSTLYTFSYIEMLKKSPKLNSNYVMKKIQDIIQSDNYNYLTKESQLDIENFSPESEIVKYDKTPYKVYTPYSKKWLLKIF